jgi:hypothetical protein
MSHDGRRYEQETTQQPQPGLQGASGAGGDQGREDATCAPPVRSAKPGRRLVGILHSTTARDPIRAWEPKRPINCILTTCPSRWQHEIGKRDGPSLRSGYALPPRRPTPTGQRNRQTIHLSCADHCSFKPSQISLPTRRMLEPPQGRRIRCRLNARCSRACGGSQVS